MSAPESNTAFKATFLSSASILTDMPDETRLEVAFAGRSNAGKSSVLNAIIGSKAMARVSKTPGHTRLINFYDLNGGGRLVDLPGYGYAKVSRLARRNWRRSIEAYLAYRKSLSGVVLVLDCRRRLQSADRQFIEQVYGTQLPLLVLLNKADKLSRSGVNDSLRATRAELANQEWVETQIFSATKGTGIAEVLSVLSHWLYDKA